MAENDRFPLLSRVVVDKPPQPPKPPTSPILPPKKPKTPKAEVKAEQIQTTIVSSEDKVKHYAEKVLNFLAIFIIAYVVVEIAISVYMLITVNAMITDLYTDMLYSEAADIFDAAYTAVADILNQLTGSIFGAAMAELIILMAKRVIKDNDGITTVKNLFTKKSKTGEAVDLESDVIEGPDSADPDPSEG